MVTQVLPFLAFFEIFDCLGAVLAGVLRGCGKQSIGMWVNIPSYYFVALRMTPSHARWHRANWFSAIGLSLTFQYGYGLFGLWAGMLVALVLVALVEFWFILRSDWSALVKEASIRVGED